MNTILLLVAILFGALGTLAVIAANNPNAPQWLGWVSWVLFTPAFISLFYAMEAFGVAGAFALWGAGTAIIVIIQGIRWGDTLSAQQIASIAAVILGLLWFGLGY